ncbi:MAG: hypothetical protein ACFFG0_47675, partial [Candidatus Thorarchaeota archaeon]
MSNKERASTNYNDLKYFYFNLQKNIGITIFNRENELIEEEIISFLKSERRKLFEIIPGRIFNFSRESNELYSIYNYLY